MNKKGEVQSDSAYSWSVKSMFLLVAGPLLVIIVLVYAYEVSSFQAKLTYLPDKMKADAISLRFANIPECLAYQDPDTERVYPGVVDINKFTNQTLLKCYRTEEEKGYEDFNFRLMLKERGGEIVTNNYFYGDQFTLFRTVLVKEGNTLTPDVLYIYVQATTFNHKPTQ